jgi:tetratricopeptide (TPR) repeat protein
VKSIFTSGVIGNYNPLPILTFAIEKYFFSPDPAKAPFIFHFNNLWMHLACTAMVFLLLRKMRLSLPAVFIGTLLFGIHPMRVESVAWVTERKDVLYGMFFLGALVTYTNYFQSSGGKAKWYILTLILSIFSYFAKVQAVTLPLTMIALDYYFKRNWRAPKTLILEKLPWWILSLGFGLINIYFLGQQKSFNSEMAKVSYTVLDRLAIGAYSYANYLVKWIFPFRMSPLYPYPPKLPVAAYISLAVVPIALVVFLIWAFRKKKTNLLFGWAFFTFNVMFLLQIVGAGQGFLADRFTYIAYIGLFFILAKGYDWIAENRPSYKMMAGIAAGVYLLTFAAMSYRQISIWENGQTLWEYVKVRFPNSPLAWKQAADYYRDEKHDYAKAIENFKEAIRLEPSDAYVYNSLAKCYMDQGFALDIKQPGSLAKQQQLVQLAIQAYNESITRDSINGMPNKKQSGETIVNRGVAYAVLNDMDRAIADLSRGLEINPDNTNGYLNRGLIYFNQSKWQLSLEDHDKYIALNQFNPDIYHERALCKMGLGRTADAIPDFNRAVFLKGDQPLYYIWRSKAYRELGKIQESVRDARQAQALGGQVPPELLKE